MNAREIQIRDEMRWRRFYVRIPNLIAAVASRLVGETNNLRGRPLGSGYVLMGLPADAIIDDQAVSDGFSTGRRGVICFYVGSLTFEPVGLFEEVPVDPNIRIERVLPAVPDWRVMSYAEAVAYHERRELERNEMKAAPMVSWILDGELEALPRLPDSLTDADYDALHAPSEGGDSLVPELADIASFLRKAVGPGPTFSVTSPDAEVEERSGPVAANGCPKGCGAQPGQRHFLECAYAVSEVVARAEAAAREQTWRDRPPLL